MFDRFVRTVVVCSTVIAVSCATSSPDTAQDSKNAQQATEPPAAESEPTKLTLPPPEGASSEERIRQAEADYEQYMSEHVLPPDVTLVGMGHATEQVQQKMRAFDRLRQQYMTIAQEGGPAVKRFASVRLGQLYLNLGCEVAAMEAPPMGDEARAIHRTKNRQMAVPMLSGAKRMFDAAQRLGGDGADKRVSAIVEAITDDWKPLDGDEVSTEVAANCEASRAYWFRETPSAKDGFKDYCDAGDGEACLAVATHDHASEQERRKYLEAGCELGNAYACGGHALDKLDSGEVGEAISLFEKECAAGHSDACISARVAVEDDKADAYAKACADGDALGCLKRATLAASVDSSAAGSAAGRLFSVTSDCVSQPIVDISSAKATKLCADGDIRGCLVRASQLTVEKRIDFGPRLPRGLRGYTKTLKDPPLGSAGIADSNAVQKAKAGCEKGEASACTRAGDILAREGEDPQAWFVKGCDRGSSTSCYRLAKWRLENDQAGAEVAGLLDKACRQGSRMACQRAAQEYISGEHLTKSRACAVGYLWSVCGPIQSIACRTLNGVMRADDAASSENAGTSVDEE